MALASKLLEFITKSSLTVHLAVLLIQFLGAITSISTQALLDAGVEKLVLGCYCFLIGGVFLGVASIFERGARLEFSLLFIPAILFLGLLMLFIQVLGYVGISKTSATFHAALQPTSTIFTAIFAFLAGVETLNVYRYDGQVKIIGIFICMAGAAVMSLYQGPCVVGGENCSQAQVNPLPTLLSVKTALDFQVGAFCIILGCALIAGLTVCGAVFARRYTAITQMLGLVFTTGAVISGVGALFTVDESAWLIPARLVPLVLLISVCSLTLIPVLAMWSIRMLGPTIVTCYQPANTIMAATLSVAYLGTSIYLGSVIGAVLIVLGLILVTWSQEETKRLILKETPPLSSSEEQQASLLASEALLSPETGKEAEILEIV